MADTGIVSQIWYFMDKYYDDVQHPISKDYWVCKWPFYQFALTDITFLLLVTQIIPYFMRDRKPFVLKWPIFVYNTFMVVANGYYFLLFLKISGYGKNLWSFEYPDPKDVTPQDVKDLASFNFYYMTKYLDWLDTIFFALKKKQSHISFLHLYHHSMVPLYGYASFRLNPFIPAIKVFGICNCFVHTIMYSYYALSTFGPGIQKYLWWKRYITQLQLFQFAIYITYGLTIIFKQTGYPIFWLYFGFAQQPFFFIMFWDFYRNAYKKKPAKVLNGNIKHEINGDSKMKSH